MSKYKAGDRVVIVKTGKNILSWNLKGGMNCWLDKIMTIKTVTKIRSVYKMIEDDSQWTWTDEMIDGFATEKDKYEFYTSPNNEVSIIWEKNNIHNVAMAKKYSSDPHDADFVKNLLIARIQKNKELEKKLIEEKYPKEIPVDWIKIAADTRVLVSRDNSDWIQAYFCTYIPKGTFPYITFGYRKPQKDAERTNCWKYCKLNKEEL